MVAQVPDKGDLVFLNFSPQSGHEQAGYRPAIVLSPKLFNRGAFLFACPITSQEKGYPFEVKVPDGYKVNGVILTDQLRSLDWKSRNLKIVDKASDTTIQECLELISTFINFD
ncbi:type II toxin-antitoxin system PemK/MazF family toxin [Ornithinibacillus contaminans]|uniref:type II toxin-antitoxin system PemK/MazF family toxin n=1 Tax=Ornithinibacillus contaminans TaxID=694055 RepID=UPI00064DD093|nr:type II toxin-antitoxin system PemK/MazF family toxin [Ornithinibacillus contaminans]